MAAYVRVETI